MRGLVDVKDVTVGTRITAANGAISVTFVLYGEVSEARLQAETFLCQRRANQLAHVHEKKSRWRRPDDDYVEY